MALHKSMKLAFTWIWIAFIALISATAVTIRYANENYTGPIEREYYEIGLNYEKSILEQRKMLEEGYSFESVLLSQNLKLGKNPIVIRFLKLPESQSAEPRFESKSKDPQPICGITPSF